MKRILMNCSYNDELRIALIEGSKLYDLDNDSDSKSLLKGSIFKARVSRIESSLDAAFVDFGSERHGFLPLKELTESFYTKDHSGKKTCTLKDGDEIIELSGTVKLSQNFFKKSKDGSRFVNMLTYRSNKCGSPKFKLEVEGLKNVLTKKGFEFEKVEVEYAVYDTNVTHDAKWILGSEEKLNEVV